MTIKRGVLPYVFAYRRENDVDPRLLQIVEENEMPSLFFRE
jgi:hypothetical protein